MTSMLGLARPRLLVPQTAFTRLATDTAGSADVLELEPTQVMRNVFNALRSASPGLAKVISVLGPLAILAYGVHQYIWKAFALRKKLLLLEPYVFPSIVIPGDHPINSMILSWIASNTVNKNAGTSSLFHGPRNFFDIRAQTPLECVPDACWFSHNGHWLRFHRVTPRTEQERLTRDEFGMPVLGRKTNSDKDITISCISFRKNTAAVKKFLMAVREQGIRQDSTLVCRISKDPGRDEPWAMPLQRPVRNLSSVTMEAGQKDHVLRDMEKYLSDGSRNWYAQRGIPYRRGYLLYGPPGTGKTSFCTALAGHFRLDIYIMSLSHPSMTDNVLEELFSSVPDRALVLIEDIDSAGVGRQTMNPPKLEQPVQKSRSKRGVTLSGLLNCIDGVASVEGRLLVMTTNSPDSLDPALIRPGRVDMKVLFGNASHEIMRTMFMHIFSDISVDAMTATTSPEHLQLRALSETFASSLPEDKLTPAEIQNFLLEHRESPTDAVEKATAWAERAIAAKASGRNVAQFSDQVGEDDDTSSPIDDELAADGESRQDSDEDSSAPESKFGVDYRAEMLRRYKRSVHFKRESSMFGNLLL